MKSYTIETEFEHEGLKCVVVAGDSGFRCGYVGITNKHPLYNHSYHEHSEILSKTEDVENLTLGKKGIIPAFCWDGELISPEIFFDVHGGITYSGGGENSEYPIKSDLWWFGYDCGHYNDAKDMNLIKNEILRDIELRFNTGGEVRDTQYCINECKNLAEQLAKIK